MWYQVTGKKGETVVSTEDEFDTMRKLAISSWANGKEYARIQLSDPKDLLEGLESQGGSEFNNMLL